MNQADVLQDILASINTMNGRLNVINGQLNNVQEGLQNMEGELHRLRGDLTYESECNIIRSLNLQQARDGRLIPIPARPGCPAYQNGDFPVNEAALPSMNAQVAGRLLLAYGMANVGSITEKRAKVARFLGRRV